MVRLTVVALGATLVTSAAPAQEAPVAPPTPKAADKPPTPLYYAVLAALTAATLMVSIIPSKRGHKD